MDLDERVRQLWDAMPANGMLILCTGAGDTARARTLQERKWKRSRGVGAVGAVDGRGGGGAAAAEGAGEPRGGVRGGEAEVDVSRWLLAIG